MKEQDKSDQGKSTEALVFLMVWFISTASCMAAGSCGAYLAGMRSGGWNMHLIYPPLIGGVIGWIIYPIIRLTIRARSEDKGKGLFSSMLASMLLSLIACFLFITIYG